MWDFLRLQKGPPKKTRFHKHMKNRLRTGSDPVPFCTANSDIEVVCGSQTVDLQILLCPIYFNGYNESLLALNSQHSKNQCKGTADWTADPPVVKFNFSISEEMALNTFSPKSVFLKVSQETGTGLFTEFSSVQYISITGMICSEDPTAGAITYHQEVMYKFSCRYPLQYLVNNTQMRGHVRCQMLLLSNDNSYSSFLNIPQGGLELKTRIFVEVKASNLTNRFNVLLDRCYATTSLFPINTTFYDLFVGCNRDGQTVMGVNGEQQEARFSFEAFRFVHSADETMSTYYVHCATRLCVSTFCPTLIQVRICLQARKSHEPPFLVAFIVYQKHNSKPASKKEVLYPQE
uniref:Si:ch73-261i21.5 n=1 Tax=Stegastes partitus TaxID=144197 RepID=A0A3B4YWX2_9TELE